MTTRKSRANAKNKKKLLNTCVGVALFPRVFKPEKYDDNEEGEGSYTVTLALDKEDREEIVWFKKLKKAIERVIKEEWGSKPPRKLMRPYADGDSDDFEEANYRESVTGKWLIKFKSKYKPEVIGKDGLPLTEEDMYSGALVRISFVIKAWGTEKKSRGRGVSLYFKHIIKIDDGERLAGTGISAEEQFEDDIESDGFDDNDFDDDFDDDDSLAGL